MTENGGPNLARKGKSRNQCPNKDQGTRRKKKKKKEPDKESDNNNSVDRMSRS